MERASTMAERLRQVLASGEAPALLFERNWLSWSSLGRMAAATLDALAGVSRDLAIAQVTRNRPSSVAAFLALLGDNRCVLQISPIQPPGPLAQEVVRMQPAVVIADREDWTQTLLAAAKECGSLAVCLDSDRVTILGVRPVETRLEHHRALPEVAIMMPTSGTTGPPKRVPITVGQLESYRADHGAGDKGGEPRVVIVAAPLFTVTGLRPLLAWATRPLRLALMERVDVRQWAEMVSRYKPREGGLPPAAMRMLLDSDVPRDALTSLQGWHTGSAPVDPDVAERFEAEFGVPVLVAYGATEFGGAVTRMTLEDRQKWGTSKRGSSGRAIPGNALRVVSQEDGSELPPGETGLLEVSAARTGGEWARTNDLAHIDEDGFLFIEGRADDVIIRGGFKVPLREVEAILETHPMVRQAAVLSEDDARLGQVPVAAVALKDEATLTAGDLKQWARENLAPYKRPARFTVLRELPMTASMKVNRPELRRLLTQASDH